MAETREIRKPKIFANTTELRKEDSGRVVEERTEESTKQVPKHGVQVMFVGPVSYRKHVHGAQVLEPGMRVDNRPSVSQKVDIEKLIEAKNVEELIKLTEKEDDKDASAARFGLLELD